MGLHYEQEADSASPLVITNRHSITTHPIRRPQQGDSIKNKRFAVRLLSAVLCVAVLASLPGRTWTSSLGSETVAGETMKYAAIGAASVTAYRSVREPAARLAKGVVGGAKSVMAKLKKNGSSTKIEDASEKSKDAEADAESAADKWRVIQYKGSPLSWDPREDLWPPPARFRPGDTCWYPKENVTAYVSRAMPPPTKDSEWLYEVQIGEDRTKQTIESYLDIHTPGIIKRGHQLCGEAQVSWDMGKGEETGPIARLLRKTNVVMFSVPNFGSDDDEHGNTTRKQLKTFAETTFPLKVKGVDMVAVVGLGKMKELKDWMKRNGISDKVVVPIADEKGELHRDLGLGLERDEAKCPQKSVWWALYLMDHRVRVVLTEAAERKKHFTDVNAKQMIRIVHFCQDQFRND